MSSRISHEIGTALLSGDLLTVTEHVERIGGRATVLDVIRLCREASEMIAESSQVSRKDHADDDWSGWIVWLKARVPIPFGGSPLTADHTTCTLHVFPIDRINTEDELQRLRSGYTAKKDTTARSKIGSTQVLELVPIDRVAQRVST